MRDTLALSLSKRTRSLVHYAKLTATSGVDALCERIGIMVTGQLRCIGSSQHLKTQYGTGFHLALKTTVEGHNEALAYVRTRLAVAPAP